MITRKKLLELLNGFDEILINHCNNGKLFKQYYQEQQAIKVEKKIIKNEKNEKKEISETKNEQKWEKSININELQLTKLKEPMLLDSLSYKLQNNIFEFKFYSGKELKAIATMNKESFQQTLSSLMRVIPFVAWGISPHILD